MVRNIILTCLSWYLIGPVWSVAEPPPANSADSQQPAPTDAEVRSAVERSLPYLETAGVNWMEGRGCMSCHHVPFLLWSFRSAQSHGLTVDSDKLAEWDEWSRKDSLARRKRFKLLKADYEKLDATQIPAEIKTKLQPLVDQAFATEAEFIAKLTSLLTAAELEAHRDQLVKTASLPIYAFERSGGGLDVLGQLLLGRSAPGLQKEYPDAGDHAEFETGVIDMMQQMQLSNGAWTPGQQLTTMRNWPRAAADQATTMWAALALAATAPATAKRSEVVERAVAFQRQQPAQNGNHEWLATRLLFERKFGSPEEVARLRQQLIAGRQPDGGWSWNQGDASDPFTTGLVLYVLAQVGGVDDPKVIGDGRRYLLRTQEADGSWLTPSLKISKTKDPERLKVRDEIYHYWGTAWSVLGLLETFPTPSR